MKSVTATSAYEVTVKLSHPDVSWAGNVPYAYVFEKNFAQEHKATFGLPGTLIMGSGPGRSTASTPPGGRCCLQTPIGGEGLSP